MPKIKISTADLQSMFQGTLVIHKNKPILIKDIETSVKFRTFDLVTQRNTAIVIDEYEDLKAPNRHLGFVNVGGHVIYMSRKTVRRYKVGLSADNAVYDAPEAFEAFLGHPSTARLYSLDAPELADTVFGRYPHISEAFEMVRNKVATVVAFDRQFAVDNRGRIHYKKYCVGACRVTPKSVYDIEFKDGYKHLITLLDTNYEKSTPTTRP